ncbi:MAG: flavodoxin domain-containing protein [Clostridiales bacterium]|nr:flavodoxin domain-containing protein [Eubacteriales bacterium]MDH7567490.1 flavodoxin domain-containing protein [Clostridiales bacterium]
MSILIAYATRHGCVKKCAESLAEKLQGKVELLNLGEKPSVELAPYDTVIIGGSIYAGNIQKEVKDFCAQNLEALKGKKLGLFICCMFEKDVAKKQLENAYPQELLDMAEAKDYFGGELILGNMGFLEKTVVKMVAKAKKDVSNILEENINKFASAINRGGEKV